QRYQERDIFGLAPNDFIKEMAGHIPKGRVLCLAEGEGRNALYLASLGYKVTAVDFSWVGLEHAQTLAQSRKLNLTTICQDLTTFDLGEAQWQGIISVFFHIPSPERHLIHQKVIRALAPQGVFLLEAFRPDQMELREAASGRTGGPSQLDRFANLANLQEELKGLDILLGQECNRQLDEGRYHQGLSAVVQVMAKKT
ncbi:MAG: class I SAM-dependent methyltransferase, partial [Deinococcales bacterium]